MGYVFFYIEAYLACAFLLCLILFKIFKGINKQLSQVYLGNIIIVLILYFFAEIFWAVVDGNLINATKSMLYVSNIFTYVLITIAAYTWYILSEALQNSKKVENDVTRLLISIPVWISAILCVSAYRTGLVFYVDPSKW